MVGGGSFLFIGSPVIFATAVICIIVVVLSVLCYTRITTRLFRLKQNVSSADSVIGSICSTARTCPRPQFALDESVLASDDRCSMSSKQSGLAMDRDPSLRRSSSQSRLLCHGVTHSSNVMNSQTMPIEAHTAGASIDIRSSCQKLRQQPFDARHIQTPCRKSCHASHPYDWICDASDDAARRARRVLALQTVFI